MGVEAEAEEVEAPLLHALPTIKRTGTVWKAAAHIITGVVGSGVLSLAWSMAQLGWIAGPLAMLFFASITLISAFLLCDCYRSPDPEFGPARNPSYLEAVHTTLGKSNAFLGGLFVQIGLYGTSIAYVVASDTSMRNQTVTTKKDMRRLLVNMKAAIMSFAYSIIGLALGFAQVIGNGYVKGSIEGITAYSAADKLWNVSQAIGDIAFANIEKWIAENHPNRRFVNKNVTCKLPCLPDFQLNLLRLCFRTIYVISTTTIAMVFPYFNQVIGLLGGFGFWPLTVYFPVEMYFKQRNIEAWTTQWIMLQAFSIICFLVTAFALIGSVEGLVRARLS